MALRADQQIQHVYSLSLSDSLPLSQCGESAASDSLPAIAGYIRIGIQRPCARIHKPIRRDFRIEHLKIDLVFPQIPNVKQLRISVKESIPIPRMFDQVQLV